MVAQKYRWDFIGLSTDEKPTAATSPKVTDGSTFYCSDNSKLYVWYNDRWYERKALGGGGGGGGSYTAGTGIDITDDTISVDTTTIQEKLTAGTNVSISDQNVISATDTTYSAFTGTDGTAAGTAGLVPAPATTDAGKFLKADGTWDTAGGGSGPTVVQTTGTSTTDVMSQNAASSMVFANPGTDTKIQIGSGAAATGNSTVSIGQGSKAEATSATAVGRNTDAKSQSSTAVGFYSKATGEGSVAVGEQTVAGSSTSALRTLAIGSNASAGLKGSVAVGAYSYAASIGEMNIGAHNQTGYGYNNTEYRLLSGLYDGQKLHDAATLAQGNTLATSAPTTSTVGVLGQLYTDTTNMHTYQCTAISGDTYTWTQRW